MSTSPGAVQAKKSQDFSMPKPTVGELVWWCEDADVSRPCAGIITFVGDRAVTVNVPTPDLRDFLVKDGVRHVSDPDLREKAFLRAERGGWDFHPLM